MQAGDLDDPLFGRFAARELGHFGVVQDSLAALVFQLAQNLVDRTLGADIDVASAVCGHRQVQVAFAGLLCAADDVQKR